MPPHGHPIANVSVSQRYVVYYIPQENGEKDRSVMAAYILAGSTVIDRTARKAGRDHGIDHLYYQLIVGFLFLLRKRSEKISLNSWRP